VLYDDLDGVADEDVIGEGVQVLQHVLRQELQNKLYQIAKDEI